MNIRLLAGAAIAVASLQAIACHHSPALSVIHLEWRGGKVKYKDSILKVISEKKLKLAITDARAEKTSHTTAKKMYFKMREGAKKNVSEAMPDLSSTLERHLISQQAAATV